MCVCVCVCVWVDGQTDKQKPIDRQILNMTFDMAIENAYYMFGDPYETTWRSRCSVVQTCRVVGL